ncbi:rhodanese-like domain-containing protein [Telmatocola sphagniphila]|uniref:Rhodanese-like domain-containing protein n=1 Tax=Telmatocola sphagniphila TaxID=1123043 RepID=A0A8E6ETL6_9BACT|nr:rhodanese-like domain-containing protein [Telmatocola sphagniphila]QVL32584.1 rhodanese-like domain-containing protein [Telmatocola sphagniphila]
MKRFFSTIAAAVLLVSFGSSQEPLMHTKDTPEEVKKNLKDKKAILLDVRSMDEWEAGHLKDATFMPLTEMKKVDEDKLKALAKDKIIYTHCGAGRRALEAGKILKEKGFDVRPLKLGFEDLVNEGFPKAEEKKKDDKEKN